MKRSSIDQDDGSSPPRKTVKSKGSSPFKAQLDEGSEEDLAMLELKPSATSKDPVLPETADVGKMIGTVPVATTGAKRFPERLYDLLNTEAAPGSLYWLPGGKAFAIEQENFASEVLDKYFQATKFASFVRRLHKWGFRRETRGFRKEIGPGLSRSVIAFCHDQFQKDSPELVREMEEVAKKAQLNSKEGPPSKPTRKRQSSAGSLNSSSSTEHLEPEEAKTSSSSKKPPSSIASGTRTPRDSDLIAEQVAEQVAESVAEQKQDMQELERPAASLLSDVRGLRRISDGAAVNAARRPQVLAQESVEHQLLLHNLRNNALHQTQDQDGSLELLLRNQQQRDSLLQRTIITASLAQQQQQQVHEHELQHQRRVALVAAATSNQGMLDAAATERLLRLQRSATTSQAAVSLGQQQQPSLPPALLAQIAVDPSRVQQQRGSNSQLVETLLLLELQRQQQTQQGGQANQQPPNQQRQFPPFG